MIKAIIFDKDGTILELGATWDEPTVIAFNRLMELTDLTIAEAKAYGEKLGIVDGKILPNSLFAAGSVLEQAEELSKVVPLSIEVINDSLEQDYLNFAKSADVKSLIVKGTEELLKYLKDQNYIIGLVTNDQRDITNVMLESSELISYFDFIGCADDYHAKPNPAALHEIAKRFDLTLDEMVYVGDSAVDMEYAKFTAAGIGVAYEEDHRDHVREANYIVSELSVIPEIIEALNKIEK
ncbi:HAD family hydrolase [Aerococcaceae bacterium DSM 111022]|nr:HAD family hydrolase [Aerococcaceae bacterium DSM 111022]